ncbi:MAG TPA: toll/interleukin-1 receptor domain-containing protein [Thermoanaerobaculia bacterium]|nr:toll/interleukin-1 receptor domain-containing protein [Thermoanaerobaculia bacterium]
MAPQPRLFISHSSQDKALTRELVDVLKPALGDHPGFEPLVDVDCLAAGEEWPQQLHAMMAYAHAGLLLFTRAAMNRPDWIRKEAYILTWRRSLDPSFKVFYTFLDDVVEKDLTDRGFGPAHLNLIQRLPAITPEEISVQLRALQPAVLPSTPFDELVLALTQSLKLEAVALEALVAKLQAPAVPWLPSGMSAAVGQIAARLLAGRFGSLRNLSGLINDLKKLGIEGEALRKVMRWVAPHWLAPEAAGKLAAVVDQLWRHGQGGWAAINGSAAARLYTARMFVYRVLPFQFQTRVAQVEGPTHDASADYYTGAICKWLREQEQHVPPDERVYPPDDEALIEQLETDEGFLFVPLRKPDKATLETLRDRFPRVVFLLWTGEQLEALGFDLPTMPLEPPVDRTVEKVEAAEWRSALNALRG